MEESTAPKLKNGFLTSEFWLSLTTSVVGIIVMLGYLSPEEADEFVKAVVSVVGGLVTITSTVTYLHGRIKLKQEQVANSKQTSQLLEENGVFEGGSGSGTYVE